MYYGVAVEYPPVGEGLPDPLLRAACQAAFVRQPGYRRRISLMADGWRRIVDLFLFTHADDARGALAGPAWRAIDAEHPDGPVAAPALLVSEGRCGDPVVLLRATPGQAGGQTCWRDRLVATEPLEVVW